MGSAPYSRRKDANVEMVEIDVLDGNKVTVVAATYLEAERLKRFAKAAEKAFERLGEIGDYAHANSTGPEVPDALWEVRSMAYELT